MHTFTDIQQEIRPICQRAEQFRLEQMAAYKKSLNYLFIPFGVLVFSLLFLFTDLNEQSLIVGIVGMVGSIIAAGIIYFSTAGKHKKTYRLEFKSKIMKAFVEMLYPTIQYNSGKSITYAAFKESELFGSPSGLSGEDYFSGTLGNLKIEFSELYAYNESSDSDGTTSSSTVFDGLFFVLESPNRVYGNVSVVPDSAESNFGAVGRWLQRNLGAYFKGAKMVYFEDYPEFEKQFVVYSANEEEARRVLTSTLLRSICELRNKWKNKIHIGFRENKIYIALPIGKNLFEAELNQSLLDNKVVQRLYNELALCFNAVQDFNS